MAKMPMVMPNSDRMVLSLFAFTDWYANCMLSSASLIRMINGRNAFINAGNFSQKWKPIACAHSTNIPIR
jgi:hypothetical protein